MIDTSMFEAKEKLENKKIIKQEKLKEFIKKYNTMQKYTEKFLIAMLSNEDKTLNYSNKELLSQSISLAGQLVKEYDISDEFVKKDKEIIDLEKEITNLYNFESGLK